MTLFWIATVLAVVITVVFVREGIREFLHVRDGADPDVTVQVQPQDDVRFSLKALGGVVVSFTCIVLISTTPYAWYLMPLLSLGSAVAVVVAFIVDRRDRTAGETV